MNNIIRGVNGNDELFQAGRRAIVLAVRSRAERGVSAEGLRTKHIIALSFGAQSTTPIHIYKHERLETEPPKYGPETQHILCKRSKRFAMHSAHTHTQRAREIVA